MPPSDGAPSRSTDGICVSVHAYSAGEADNFFETIRTTGSHTTEMVVGSVIGPAGRTVAVAADCKAAIDRVLDLLPHDAECDPPLPQPHATVAELAAAMRAVLGDSFQCNLLYLRLDTLRRKVIWCGCGEVRPVVAGHGLDPQVLHPQNTALGGAAAIPIVQSELPFCIGQFVFYGASGALDMDSTHLVNQLSRNLAGPNTPAMALQRLHELLVNNPGPARHLFLLMALQREENLRCTQLELSISLTSLNALRSFVAEQSRHVQLDEKQEALLTLAAVEVMTNIIRHARGLLPNGSVDFVAERSAQSLVLSFHYIGAPYTPPDNPQLSEMDTYPEGGFGHYIIQQSCDRVTYSHANGVNTIRLEVSARKGAPRPSHTV